MGFAVAKVKRVARATSLRWPALCGFFGAMAVSACGGEASRAAPASIPRDAQPPGSSAGAANAPAQSPEPAGVAGRGEMGLPNPFAEVPSFPLEMVREIELSGFEGAPEDIVVNASGILVATIERTYSFALDGSLLDMAANASPVLGMDSNNTVWSVTTYRNVLKWRGWEMGAYFLDGVGNATGVAVGENPADHDERDFVTDSANSTTSEHLPGGGLVRQLALPGTDLQGIAFSTARALFVLDAKRARIFRLSADLASVEKVLMLPGGGGMPSGIHFDAEDLLYVCSRDTARVRVFRSSEI